MALKTYAAILIGSVETELRIYEFSARRGMKEIDCIGRRINLASSAYSRGTLDMDRVEELCTVLKDFRTIMDTYNVDGYDACGTSALRETRSSLLMRDYIEKQTGLKIRVLSNSEQRFLDYKSIACESDSFDKIIQNGTAIVDIGGNSTQISVFDKDKLITTQNIRMGKVSVHQQYRPVTRNNVHFEAVVTELLNHELSGFGKLYQKERQIRNLIIVDNDLLEFYQKYSEKTGGSIIKSGPSLQITSEQMDRTLETVMPMRTEDLSWQYGISEDTAQLVLPSLIFCRSMLAKMEAEVLWLMDVSICDGLCYDFGIKNKLISQTHNFEEDIIAASRSIAKRYKSNQAHLRNMEEISLGIFSKTKKIHGMGQREKLLLQIAVILHNCGKYISLVNVSDCAYNIIMATEIIGLSHAERQIIANVVKYNTAPFCYYDEMARQSDVTRREYLVIAKLTAILRLANALDRSHKQKFAGVAIVLRDNTLQFHIETREDLTLEKITLKERAEFFEEVFNIRPVIKQKKKNQGA